MTGSTELCIIECPNIDNLHFLRARFKDSQTFCGTNFFRSIAVTKKVQEQIWLMECNMGNRVQTNIRLFSKYSYLGIFVSK